MNILNKIGLTMGLVAVTLVILPTITLGANPTASLAISPTSGSQAVGTNFNVDVKLTTGGQAVGGVGVALDFSDNLEYVSADTAGSVFDTQVTAPTVSGNRLSFSRVRLDTGYDGSLGQLAKLTFKPKATGTGTLTINQSSSEVIAYSDESNILGSVTNGSYALADPGANTTPPAAQSTTGVAKDKSVVTVTKACALNDRSDSALLKVEIKDSSGKVLKTSTYKPTVVVNPSKSITSTVVAEGESWKVSLKSSTIADPEITVSSSKIELGKVKVKFAAICPGLSVAPSPSISVAAVVASPSLSPLPRVSPRVAPLPKVTPNTTILGVDSGLFRIGLLVLALIALLIGGLLWLRLFKAHSALTAHRTPASVTTQSSETLLNQQNGGTNRPQSKTDHPKS